MSKRRDGGEQTKNFIVAKAHALFSEKGYAATSMDDICDATGRSIGNIYYHFKSKEDLFLYILEQNLTEGWERWGKISSQYESATEKLYAFADDVVDGPQRPLLSVVGEFYKKVGADTEVGQRLMTLMYKNFEPFVKLVSEGITRGEFKNENPQELAAIIFSLYAGLDHQSKFMEKETKKVLFRKGTTLFLQGISTRNDI
ncbi:Transcriptional regulator, TetR family [Desulfosporosinus sp. I2]|uniref:TetR/AcrR family transcriptional regulator n=1 Tax=Desulfosporosinus sp. I2 TaxID=1617025 RepID=UPI0005F00655|nr:TetR/AcrR family transcriptional regulator [Desulfosporosinus sp. I2]KJR47139.1 Transcriptional regulator, TetR family [Desulfosporosinus sp. I2]